MTSKAPLTAGDAAQLLAWYAEMGVDVGLEEIAPDHLDDAPRPVAAASAAASETSPQRTLPSLAVPSRTPQPPSAPRTTMVPASTPSPDESERTARESARSAATLDELRAALERFEGCGLRKTATQLVFADGNPAARVMLVGEAPGRDEDLQGLPFVGRSGQLLDRMLAAIGLDRTSVYVANVVPWRPPGNRTPTPQETAACRPFIMRQIELANPDFLMCLGAPAAAELMHNRQGILKFRGQWKDFDTGTRTIKAMASLHPAYLLRQPVQKRLAWRDFLALKAALEATA